MEEVMKPNPNMVQELKKIFAENITKRIIILGTNCCGKTTLIRNHFPECFDIDLIVLSQMSEEMRNEFVEASWPWTEKLKETWDKNYSETMKSLKIEAGHPLFSAVIFDSDIIVYLNIDEKTLYDRTKMRDYDYELAVECNNYLKEYIKTTNLPVIVVDVS